MGAKERQLLHLYNRAGFGISPAEFLKLKSHEVKPKAAQLMRNAVEEKSIQELDGSPFAKYAGQMQVGRDRRLMRQMVQKEVRASRGKILDLNLRWMDQLTNPSTMVREKMTLFWHDHFGVRNLVGYYVQQHNNTLRKHALGKYGDLLLAVTQDPAMLQFLNNQQNVKRKPNENYARELLELFTLGRGHYTEQDIKNAARAFTGWGYDPFGNEFRFRRFQHDEGHKEFMGRKGNLNGDDILKIVLDNRQTSRFLATKLFQYYVSDKPDAEVIELMAQRLFKTDYDIGDLLGSMLGSDWFYEDRFINKKIKSPIELINSLRLHFGLSFGQPRAWLYLQRILGQVLFYPPSVNGWATGAEWIDHSSLMSRMSMPRALASGNELAIRPKSDGDENNPLNRNGSRLVRTAQLNFEELNNLGKGPGSVTHMIAGLSEFLLNRQLARETVQAMEEEMEKRSGLERLKWAATSFASFPEYQMN